MCLFLRYHGGETVDPSTINKLVTPIMELFQERMSGSSLVLLHQETMLVVFLQVVLVHWDYFSLRRLQAFSLLQRR